MGRTYSYIHKKLVENSNDIIGHIAYSLYKEDKSVWIARKQKDGGPGKPTEKQIESYTNDIAQNQNTLNKYKEQAEKVLRNYMALVIAEDREEQNRQNVDAINTKIDEKTHGWWYGFLQSLAAALAFAFLGAVLSFILVFNKKEFKILVIDKEKTEIPVPSSESK